jgi:hypothetical protein
MLQYFLEVEVALTCLLLGGTEICDRQEEADERQFSAVQHRTR